MCRRSERDLHRDHIRAWKCGISYLQLKFGVREEGIKDLGLTVTVPPEKCSISHLFAQYKLKLMPVFIGCHIYKRWAVGLKIKFLIPFSILRFQALEKKNKIPQLFKVITKSL